MDSTMKKMSKLSIQRHGLPAELFNELFVSMPLENAFELLTKLPNGILARNVLKMVNGIKDELKKNKLNSTDSGPKLIISEDGLVLKHSGGPIGRNSVRALLPIPKFNLKAITKPIIAFYFEIEILKQHGFISIGFCDRKFPLEDRWLGEVNNSIGICSKKEIWIDGSDIVFDNEFGYFERGDFAGIDIIHFPNARMEIFATNNGKLLRKAKLSSNFANVQLFPAVDMFFREESIRANFKKEEWKFREFKSVLE